MAQQYWDDVLYPPFRAMIRGSYYGILSRDSLDEECFNIARRAVAAFKFPKISTSYTTFYAVRLEDGSLQEADKDTDNAIQHAYFNNELGYAEIEIIVAWMKYFWCEYQISNADNFEDVYTDANIKSYSRANALAQGIKLFQAYKEEAKELEMNYGRVSAEQTPTMGEINSDE